MQQLVDRTIIQADKDGDGMISFEEFKDVILSLKIIKCIRYLKKYFLLYFFNCEYVYTHIIHFKIYIIYYFYADDIAH